MLTKKARKEERRKLRKRRRMMYVGALNVMRSIMMNVTVVSEVWIECESCYKWYNLNCTTQQFNDNLEEIDFVCKLCI